MTGFFSLLLWAGGILCFVGYALKKEEDNLYLGIVLCFVVFVTGCFTYAQNRKSSNLMESFKNMMPTMTTVIRGGTPKQVSAEQLVVGDVIRIKGGDKIPADVRIIECSDDMHVDNSSLTGESEPQKRTVEQTHANPLETKNLAFFGTFCPQGTATGVVVNTGDYTAMGRIATLASMTDTEDTPIKKEIEHFVSIVSAVAIFLGVTFFIIGLLLGTDLITNLVFMIGIIVANVPEGLLATVTVCLTLTANRMSKKMVLVKNLEAVETLGSTTCICSDKTGTLTQNIMTVSSLIYDRRVFAALDSNPEYIQTDLSFQKLTRCATLCNNAVFDEESKFKTEGGSKSQIPFKGKNPAGESMVLWRTIGDASESAMIKFCQDKKDISEYRKENPKLKEIPFNSANKYQASIHVQEGREDRPRLLVMKGAPERILQRCDRYIMNGQVHEIDDGARKHIEDLQLELSKRGQRVLGFAELELDVDEYPSGYPYNSDNPNFPLGEPGELQANQNPRIKQKLVFLGMMGLIDPPRPAVPHAVAKCKTAGIKVVMVTGDHPVTAKAIAQQVGIIWGPTAEDVIEKNEEAGLRPGQQGWEDPDLAPAIVKPGSEIGMDLSQEEWKDILHHEQIVFAR